VEQCWLDQSLFDAFTAYYLHNHRGETMLCMVSGKETTAADQHPKGIIPINGNAKLISANDSSGFTYRGRFNEEWQAASIGYEASQKAHNALRWLAQEQHVTMGGRTFLCWNPQGKTIVPAHLPFMPPPKPIFKPSDYKKTLREALMGKKAELELTDGVVVAAFDAATTGRLSLTYYNELLGHDFLQRLHDWDTSCCWPHWKFGITTPLLYHIVNCAFGTQRGEKLETDERILRQQMQRIITCRVDKAAMSADIVKALVSRASNPQAYDNHIWENILFTACAVIRKYRMDKFKEEWNMALEPEKNDRSYQFGRLLAVMEKVERDTYGSSEDREPNAIRLQSVFCQRPMATAGALEKQLDRAYFPRLKPGSRIWYKNLLGQIMAAISAFPQDAWNKPLTETYLMGYYLQRNALYTKNNDNDMEETGNE
jgi:CRISPR-associated protein Csd1